MIATIAILFSFSACSQKSKITFVKSKCPKSRIWDINKTVPAFKLVYKKDKKSFIIEEDEFFNYVDFVKDLKKRVIFFISVIELYKEQSREINKLGEKNEEKHKR
jgi:hypothetical protein